MTFDPDSLLLASEQPLKFPEWNQITLNFIMTKRQNKACAA